MVRTYREGSKERAAALFSDCNGTSEHASGLAGICISSLPRLLSFFLSSLQRGEGCRGSHVRSSARGFMPWPGEYQSGRFSHADSGRPAWGCISLAKKGLKRLMSLGLAGSFETCVREREISADEVMLIEESR